MYDSVTWCIGHLGNSSQNNTDFLNDDNFTVHVKNSFINININLIRRILITGNCQVLGSKFKFSNILIFAWKLDHNIANTKVLHRFPLEIGCQIPKSE